MLKAENSNQALPPAVLAYLNAPVQAALQFDFLIGEWAVEGRQHLAGADRRYFATWRAQYLHDKRMIMDDFTVLAGSGLEISAFVTLRTYSPLTERWEMTGMAALQPASNGKWFGSQVGDEMHLEAEGPDPDGRMLKNRIRFYAIKPHRFEWESHVSADGGQTWNKAASLVATRTR